MKIALGLLATAAAAALAGGAWADPEVIVKCDSTTPTAQRVTRDHNKFAIEVTGDVPLTSHAVFPLPMQHIERFRVLGHDGVETFYLVTGANSGKTELKHSIYGGKDGSHIFNIRVMTLDHCDVVSPDVVVGKEGQASPAARARSGP
jgi:hypothetical protein